MKRRERYQCVAREKRYRIHCKRYVRKDIFTAFGKINLCGISQNINIDPICSTKVYFIATFSGWFIYEFVQKVLLFLMRQFIA
jgi:hypothetical protein